MRLAARSAGRRSESEAELVERLARIRAAVAGEITDAAGVAAVRSALLRLFDGFTLRRDIPDRAHVELIDTRWIEPRVSEKAVRRLRRETAAGARAETA